MMKLDRVGGEAEYRSNQRALRRDGRFLRQGSFAFEFSAQIMPIMKTSTEVRSERDRLGRTMVWRSLCWTECPHGYRKVARSPICAVRPGPK